MILQKTILFIFLITIFNFTTILALEFSEHQIGIAGENNIGVIAVDFNNDSKMDIVTACNSQDEIWLYENLGNLDNWKKRVVGYNYDGQYLCSAYINNDEYPDFISSNALGGEVTIWYTTFIDTIVYWVEEQVAENFDGAHMVCAEDLDNDNDIDIIAAAAGLGHICWWENDNGNWIQRYISDDFAGVQSIYVKDMNGDGWKDIVGGSMNYHQVATWYSSGTDSLYWAKQTHSSDFELAHWVTVDDINNDSYDDIIGASYWNYEISWWENNSSIIFPWEKNIVDTTVKFALTVQAGKLDEDDSVDLVASSWGYDQVYYWTRDNGVWNKQSLPATINGAWVIALADFDNDTDLDLVVGADVLNSPGISAPLTIWENLIDVSITSNTSIIDEEVNIFPNPISNLVNIKFNKRNIDLSQIELYDLTGRKITERVVPTNNRGEFQFSINDFNRKLQSGIYFLKFKTSETVLVKKILIFD